MPDDRAREAVLAFIPDLFFSTKVGTICATLGRPFTVARTEADLMAKAAAARPAILLVDLTAPAVEGLLTRLREGPTAGLPLLGYTTHADWKRTKPLHERCDRVITKDEIATDFPGELDRGVRGRSGAGGRG
jgi:CheY-like chemotaxis protein